LRDWARASLAASSVLQSSVILETLSITSRSTTTIPHERMRRERRTTGNISATAWRMKLAVVSKNTRSYSEGAPCQIDRAEDVERSRVGGHRERNGCWHIGQGRTLMLRNIFWFSGLVESLRLPQMKKLFLAIKSI
jgi:hypothetical protein